MTTIVKVQRPVIFGEGDRDKRWLIYARGKVQAEVRDADENMLTLMEDRLAFFVEATRVNRVWNLGTVRAPEQDW